jgi:hypothetical protein
MDEVPTSKETKDLREIPGGLLRQTTTTYTHTQYDTRNSAGAQQAVFF